MPGLPSAFSAHLPRPAGLFDRALAACMSKWLGLATLLLTVRPLGAGSQGGPENVTHPYGELAYGYWGEGTTYPCARAGDKDCQMDPLEEAIMREEAGGSNEPCVINGHLIKSANWYGYLATLHLHSTGGRFYYRFVYPEDRCCTKILLYLEEQVLGLRARMNCLQKQSLVDPSSRQVITLSPSVPSSGCVSNKTQNGVRVIECTSGRILKSNEDRVWYIAASSCGSPTGLDIRYSFVVYGYLDACPESTTGGARSCHHCASLSFTFLYVTAIALWCRLVLVARGR